MEGTPLAAQWEAVEVPKRDRRREISSEKFRKKILAKNIWRINVDHCCAAEINTKF